MFKIEIDKNKCTGEGTCRTSCPKGPKVFEIKEIDGRKTCVIADDSYCLGCTTCIARCPKQAIRRVESR
jgi:NAD-dependent dihydropyrimidine dehydrogenase PreA subunit